MVELLHRHRLAGATVLVGIDGTLGSRRERTRFFSSNAEVPVLVVSVGEVDRVAAVLPDLAAMLPRPLVGLERVRVCKRDGRRFAGPQAAPGARHGWVKLTVHSREAARHEAAPLHGALIGRLRAEGAAAALAVRGAWGFHGDHVAHGDFFWAMRRGAPVVTTVIDRAERAPRWFEVVDEVTAATGLVTSEAVPLMAKLPDPAPE